MNHHDSVLSLQIRTVSSTVIKQLGTESGSQRTPAGVHPFAIADYAATGDWYGVISYLGFTSSSGLTYNRISPGGTILSTTLPGGASAFNCYVARGYASHWVLLSSGQYAMSYDDGANFGAFNDLPQGADLSYWSPVLGTDGGTIAGIIRLSSWPNTTHVLRSSDSGTSWQLSAPLTAMSAFGLATDMRGRWIAAFNSEDSNTTDVYVRVSDNDAMTWRPPVKISGAYPRTTAYGHVHIAADKRGHWVAIWNGGQAVSDDDGETWQPQSSPMAVPSGLNSDGTGRWAAVESTGGLSYREMNLFPKPAEAQDWTLYP